MLNLVVLARRFLAAAFVGILALAAPAVGHAAAPDTGSKTVHNSSAKSKTESCGYMKGDWSPEAMEQRVEKRISMLHDKLGITPEQEDDWNDVALAMRDNGTRMSETIEQRREKGEGLTALDRLQIGQKMAQEHADSLKRVADALEPLYEKLSPEQQKIADRSFSMEGMHDRMKKISGKHGVREKSHMHRGNASAPDGAADGITPDTTEQSR